MQQIQLKPTEIADLPILYEFQLDKEAIHMAAFTSKNPTDKAAYLEKFTKHLNDPTINQHTIWVDNAIAGSIAKYERDGHAEITYWIARNHWGKGIGTSALKNFLAIELSRPIYGGAAFDNYGSQRVLEKCGFVKIATDKGFANARGAEIEEVIYRLE